mgnify:CR=1 FL=1
MEANPPAPGRASAQLAEEGPDVVEQQVGGFHGGEVAAAVELRPVHQVVVIALGEAPDGLEVVGEDGDAGARLAHAGLGLGQGTRTLKYYDLNGDKIDVPAPEKHLVVEDSVAE